MSTVVTDDFMKDLGDLSKLLLEFASVNRATYIDVNRTPESDTDHTVMLAVVACAVAATYQPNLDIGKVAQFALVHDLVEVYSGDVNTIDFDSVDLKGKELAESKALAKIKAKFGKTFPWIHETIEAYESLESPEARFIKTIDKITPALCHIHTNNEAVHDSFDDPKAFENSVNKRQAHMADTYAHDQDLALEIREILLDGIIDEKYKYHGEVRSES